MHSFQKENVPCMTLRSVHSVVVARCLRSLCCFVSGAYCLETGGGVSRTVTNATGTRKVGAGLGRFAGGGFVWDSRFPRSRTRMGARFQALKWTQIWREGTPVRVEWEVGPTGRELHPSVGASVGGASQGQPRARARAQASSVIQPAALVRVDFNVLGPHSAPCPDAFLLKAPQRRVSGVCPCFLAPGSWPSGGGGGERDLADRALFHTHTM
jgi:hypothetical protein